MFHFLNFFPLHCSKREYEQAIAKGQTLLTGRQTHGETRCFCIIGLYTVAPSVPWPPGGWMCSACLCCGGIPSGSSRGQRSPVASGPSWTSPSRPENPCRATSVSEDAWRSRVPPGFWMHRESALLVLNSLESRSPHKQDNLHKWSLAQPLDVRV